MSSITYIAGIVPASEMMRFKKLVFRSTKGQSITHFNQLENSSELGSEKMAVYVIILTNTSISKNRILKISEQVSSMAFEIDGREDSFSLSKQVQEL